MKDKMEIKDLLEKLFRIDGGTQYKQKINLVILQQMISFTSWIRWNTNITLGIYGDSNALLSHELADSELSVSVATSKVGREKPASLSN